MRSWLTYTAARLGLFAGAFGIVYLFGARSWMALILAWVISGLASYVLLSKWRDQISQKLVQRSEERRGIRLGERLEGGATREDHLQDAAEDAQNASEEPQSAAEDAQNASDEPQNAEHEPAEGEADPDVAQEPTEGEAAREAAPEPAATSVDESAGPEPKADAKADAKDS